MNLTSIEQQLEKYVCSSEQGGYDSHPAIGAYNSPYFYMTTITSGVPDCSPSGNLAEKVDRPIYGMTYVDQVTGDIYKYDHEISHLLRCNFLVLFISVLISTP